LPTEEDGQKAGDQMLGEAGRIQDKTQESLDYTKQLVAESKDVGLSSLEELKRQRETLNRIDQEADRIDTALDVAEKLVKNFGKRMASDKFIQCFSVLNVLLLVGVILYVVLSGKSLGGADSGARQNPDRSCSHSCTCHTNVTSIDTNVARIIQGPCVPCLKRKYVYLRTWRRKVFVL
jgi:SNARE protein